LIAQENSGSSVVIFLLKLFIWRGTMCIINYCCTNLQLRRACQISGDSGS